MNLQCSMCDKNGNHKISPVKLNISQNNRNPSSVRVPCSTVHFSKVQYYTNLDVIIHPDIDIEYIP